MKDQSTSIDRAGVELLRLLYSYFGQRWKLIISEMG